MHSSTNKLSKNPIMHGRNKHIDVRLRNCTRDCALELVYCGIQDQVPDVNDKKPLKLKPFKSFEQC